MARKQSRTLITNRDLELLEALDRTPLTIEQLLKVSQTFGRPFNSDSRVRGRLQSLRQAGWVRRWQYATASRGGAPDYYQLTLVGYRLLHGPDAEAPTKRYFNEIGLARQHHTQKLADFIVHTAVCAHLQGLPVVNFRRENTLRLRIADESLFPDAAFGIRLPDQEFDFMVELDNSSERIRSSKDTDSWERKIRLYDQYQDIRQKRFRVLVVTTRSRERLDHILDAAAALVRNQQRSLFCGVFLDDYLAEPDAISQPCFRNRFGKRSALIPVQPLPILTTKVKLAPAVAAC